MKLKKTFGIVLLIAIIIISGIWFISINYIDNSSYYSFMGGAIGGLISGAFAFLGVYYTIRYYKDSDQNKELMAVRPFILATIDTFNPHIFAPIFPLFRNDIDRDSTTSLTLKIKNIGNGYAHIQTIENTKHHNKYYYNRVIEKDGIDYICIILDDSEIQSENDTISFSLTYQDSMSNMYCQEYSFIKNTIGKLIIENEHPHILT